MFLFCLVFAMSLCASVYMCFVVTCWERADLLALVCSVYCEFVTFPLVSQCHLPLVSREESYCSDFTKWWSSLSRDQDNLNKLLSTLSSLHIECAYSWLSGFRKYVCKLSPPARRLRHLYSVLSHKRSSISSSMSIWLR